MQSVNKVILIGRVGKDPEKRYLPSGEAVTSFSVATSDGTGEKEKTEWHNVVCFKRLAEIAGEYVTKGKPVYIEGKTRTRSWEKDGHKHYKTEVYADRLILLDGKGEARATAADEAPAHDITDDDIPF